MNDGTTPTGFASASIGATNPAYFGLYARRRMDLYGASPADFALVKVKNSRHGHENPNARYRSLVSADEVDGSPVVADPLRLLDICATSDGAAAVVLGSERGRPPAGRHRHGASSGRLDGHAPLPEHGRRPSRHRDRLGRIGVRLRRSGFRPSIAAAAYEEAGVGPEDLSLAEVYDLSTALELDWYEDIGLCQPGEAEKLLHEGATTIGGRIPVNPSGGLACFGEAVPAQAIAQVCEVTWQLRGSGRRPPGRGRPGRAHHQPGTLRARVLRHPVPMSDPAERINVAGGPGPTVTNGDLDPARAADAGLRPVRRPLPDRADRHGLGGRGPLGGGDLLAPADSA